MITNKKMTYFHKTLGANRLEKWDRYTFNQVWLFGGKGSSVNKGYENANDVNVRIPMDDVDDITIFKVGDIIVVGDHGNITKQSDLADAEYYNVTSINVNDFGKNPHVHLGGK